jgi:hypothetical protein
MGSDVCIHLLSARSTLRVVDRASRMTSSYRRSSGLLAQGDVRSKNMSRGAVRMFRSKYRLSCEGIRDNLFVNSCSSNLLLPSTESRVLPRNNGAPSNVTVAESDSNETKRNETKINEHRLTPLYSYQYVETNKKA